MTPTSLRVRERIHVCGASQAYATAPRASLHGAHAHAIMRVSYIETGRKG